MRRANRSASIAGVPRHGKSCGSCRVWPDISNPTSPSRIWSARRAPKPTRPRRPKCKLPSRNCLPAFHKGGAHDPAEVVAMPPGPLAPRAKTHKERRAKPARRSFAFNRPRPPLLGDFTKESRRGKTKNKTLCRRLRHRSEGLLADAFFGASPVVASALGIRLGATPRGRFDSNAPRWRLPLLRHKISNRKEARQWLASLQAHLV